MKRLFLILAVSLSFSVYGQNWTLNGSHIYYNSGNVGIGTTTPGSKLDIVGPAAGAGATLRLGGGGDMIINTGGTLFFDGNYSYASGSYIRPIAPNTQTFFTSGAERLRISSNGFIGIGTANPLAKLHISGGDLIIDPASGNPTIFTGTASSELNRYIHIINSLSYNGASGLKAGGILVADTYGYAYPGKNDLIVKGMVGIGIAAPAAKLDIQAGPGSLDGLRLYKGSDADKNWLRFSQGAGAQGVYRLGQLSWGEGMAMYVGGSDPANPGTMIQKWNFNGNVGIGTSAPGAKFQVNGNTGNPAGTDIISIIENPVSIAGAHFVSEGGNNIMFQLRATGDNLPNTELRTWGSSYINARQGNVGIGTTSPDSKLTVKGNIHTQEVRVDLLGAVAPDYVFEENYNLPSLQEIETYIKENKHLPEVPSAKEMEANGMNLKEMNLLLLKKVEELTLHMIEQQKKIYELETKLKNK
ncbi:MAG: hypothetical protein ACOYXT_02985 [Bacteroidota bacterium]